MPSVPYIKFSEFIETQNKTIPGPPPLPHFGRASEFIHLGANTWTIYCAHTICWTISGIHGTCTFSTSHTCTICCATCLAVLIQENYLVQCTITCTIPGIHGTCIFPPSHTCTICCATPLAVLIQEKYLVQCTITCTTPGIHGTCTFPPSVVPPI